MSLRFEKMESQHGREVMAIFNDYIENSFAAYPETRLPEAFYGRFLEMTKDYPAFAIKDVDSARTVGFCFLRAYNPLPVFRETALVSYFLEKEAVGKGIGQEALRKLEEEAKAAGIGRLLAEIAAPNEPSLKFHRKNGFRECGRFSKAGKKHGRYFDVIWMEKELGQKRD